MITLPDEHGRPLRVGAGRIVGAELIEEHGMTYLQTHIEVGPDVAHNIRERIEAEMRAAEEHDTDG